MKYSSTIRHSFTFHFKSVIAHKNEGWLKSNKTSESKIKILLKFNYMYVVYTYMHSCNYMYVMADTSAIPSVRICSNHAVNFVCLASTDVNIQKGK